MLVNYGLFVYLCVFQGAFLTFVHDFQNNVAVILQSLKDHASSAKFFERACETQEAVFGKDHVITASA